MSTTDYEVRGMTCGHCVSAVTAEVSKVEGVTDVRVDLASGRVTVEAARTVPADAVAEAVASAGYELVAS